ncbi:hypothetical protein [Psychromonas hadalis]|uniref:hypothetical protein n=1 Tax=Psychromonas hadalis TaxID=211669 RepID=UPI0003B4C1BF|nr:hypothetical protein [Psychromonas hadalis]
MLIFTKDFNCCKTVICENFGVSESDTYIKKSERLGYLSTECTLCGSNPPWINNELVKKVLAEKLQLNFGQKIVGCKKCSPTFFITATPPSKLHGFTSAGTQRKKCTHCGAVFTLPDFKSTDALKIVLASLMAKKEIKNAIKESGLSARLYYFYLNKLALILSNFSRINEQKILQREYLGMHSEGRLVSLSHQRGLYVLFTAEIESGYILLQTNNLTKHQFADKFIYHETKNTLASNIDSDNLEEILLARYQNNLKRNHFEQVIVGDLKPIVKCNAIYPDKVAYVHFQLLKAFTEGVQQYEHYIEHESTLRAAALMSSFSSIKNATANIYFFLPFVGSNQNLKGKPIGWWNDIWFSNEVGAFCPVTCKLKGSPSFSLHTGDAIENFYRYINNNMNKNCNSMQVIDNLSEIYRVIYNYCVIEKDQSAASRLGITDHVYQTEALLEEALQQIKGE